MEYLILGLAVLLLLGLGILQLKFFHEGDRRCSGSPTKPAAAMPSAPADLRNPRMRLIWENMARTRALMCQKEEEARDRQRQRQHALLGLTDEEEILLVTECAWIRAWPVAGAALVCLLLSPLAVDSNYPMVAFLPLVLGLLGLLALAAWRGKVRYYLTNFRLLVRQRHGWPGRPCWRVLHYEAIRASAVRRAFAGGTVIVQGKDQTIELTGLGRVQVDAVVAILRERLPAATISP